jgi:serine/threonine protein kinase
MHAFRIEVEALDDWDADNWAIDELSEPDMDISCPASPHDSHLQGLGSTGSLESLVPSPRPSSHGLNSKLCPSLGSCLEQIPESKALDTPGTPCKSFPANPGGCMVAPGQFNLLKVLGDGESAKVYLATWKRGASDSESDKKETMVAVKKFKGQVSRLSGETLCLNVEHPNLVRCYGAWFAAKPYFMAMEYCKGGTLYDRIYMKNAEKLTWNQRRKILVDISEGMHYLHMLSPRVIHRDLKSTNVLLANTIVSENDEPLAKVADFGLARTCQVKNTHMTQCVGTWRWMAPEVLSSQSYSEKVDIFSFAMVMYEVLTLRLPYQDKWREASVQLDPRICLAILEGLRPKWKKTSGGEGCPQFLINLMNRCWDQAPSSRPAFVDILQELQKETKVAQIYDNIKAYESRQSVSTCTNSTGYPSLNSAGSYDGAPRPGMYGTSVLVH